MKRIYHAFVYKYNLSPSIASKQSGPIYATLLKTHPGNRAPRRVKLTNKKTRILQTNPPHQLKMRMHHPRLYSSSQCSEKTPVNENESASRGLGHRLAPFLSQDLLFPPPSLTPAPLGRENSRETRGAAAQFPHLRDVHSGI